MAEYERTARLSKRDSKSAVGNVDEAAKEAISKIKLSIEADSANRLDQVDDVNFSFGDQWPAEIKQQRYLDRRPFLTINKTDSFVRNVVNNMRLQRPRMKVHPVSDGADQVKADLFEGILRHIEHISQASLAYDTLADWQVRAGEGFIRVLPKYADEKSFDMEIYIERINNPFSVYFDPASSHPSGMDAEWAIIVDRIKKEEFERLYPWAKMQDFEAGGYGDSQVTYSTKEEIYIGEYFRFKYKNEMLFKLANGKTYFESELTGKHKVGDFVGNSIIIDARESVKKQLCWSKVTKTQELEYKELPGKYLWVLRAIGVEVYKDGKVTRSGMVRQLKDPQKMYNFWRTQETEFVALAPKAPWLIAEGQVENHEDEWASSNVKNHSTLTWRPVADMNGQTLPPPSRVPPQPIPAASVNAAMSAGEDLKAVAGMFDPSLGAPGQETSGVMVQRRQQQSDVSNFHFYDNLTTTIKALGMLLLDLIPHYYSGPRVVRIIKPDGNPDLVTINEQKAGEILNDVNVGKYDIVMETGPGYETKRMEATDKLINLLKALPQVGQMAGDLIVGQMDFPEAQEVAERMAMANPMAQISNNIPKDLDPKAKPIVAQLMGQLQQAQQQIQQLNMEKMAKVMGVQEREKSVTDREIMKELAETKRLHFREDKEDQREAARNLTNLHETLIDSNTDLAIHHDRPMEKGISKPEIKE